MNKSGIALIIIGACNLIGQIIKVSANDYAKERAKKDASDSVTEEEKYILDEAKKRCESYSKIMDRESKELQKELKTWKTNNNYDSRKIDILNASKQELNDFKAEIEYSENIQKLERNLKAGIKSFKDSINYDDEKTALEEIIEEAEDHYESLTEVFDIGEDDDDISEVTMKLRHAAEEVKNAKVKEAKSKLKALDKKLSDETERLTKIKDQKVRSLEETVKSEKLRLDDKATEKINSLNSEKDSAKSDIFKGILDKRTESEKQIIESHNDDVQLIRQQKDHEVTLAKDILKNKPQSQKIGEYLTSQDIPKWVVAFCGAIPLVPVGYLVYRYSNFMRNVLKAM